MGCCASCDNGEPCDCGGNCNGSCGKNPYGYPPVQMFTAAQAHDSGISHPGDVYNYVMSGEFADNVNRNAKLWRKGDYLNVRYQLPGDRGYITATVPFAPIMTFCQNLAMAYGTPETRPSTVMGFAPILALVTSQLASQKVVEDAAAKGTDTVAYPPGYSPQNPPPTGTTQSGKVKTAPPGAQSPYGASSPYGAMPMQTGPFDLTQLLKLIPGLTMMMGVSYDEGLSEVAQVVMGKDETSMGACGCGVPCDGIQQNSKFMDIPRVVRRNRGSTPWNAEKFQRFWRQAPRVNDQADNHFGRAKSPPPSATPPNGWPNEPIHIEEYHAPQGSGLPNPNAPQYVPGSPQAQQQQQQMLHEVLGYDDMGLNCAGPIRNTPACRRFHHVSGSNYVEVNPYEEEQAPCKNGGTCGKSCCRSH